MATRTKLVELAGIGIVELTKNKRSKHIKLRITPDGKTRVTLPYWVPYNLGAGFAANRREWIKKHKPTHQPIIHGSIIMNAYLIEFYVAGSQRFSSIVGDRLIKVYIPKPHDLNSQPAKAYIQKVCERELKIQARNQLLPRLEHLSRLYNLPYHSAVIKKLTSRWGSCNSKKQISLSCFLAQLPDELIDYVLTHELNHTRYLNHGMDFYNGLAELLPDFKNRQKQLKTYQPKIFVS